MKERRDKKRKRKASSSSQKQPAKRKKSDNVITVVDTAHVEDLEDKSSDKEAALDVKSLIKLSGEFSGNCLLFLKRRQNVAVLGKTGLKPLIGLVDVNGHTLEAGQQFYHLFSPLTSSLLTITDSSSDDEKRSEQLLKVKEIVKSQHSDTAKKALSRARKAASVVLLCHLQHLACDFVTHYEPYCNIFGDISNQEDGVNSSITKVESSLKKKTLDLGFQLLEPDCERFRVVIIPDQWNAIAKRIQEGIRASEDGSVHPMILLCGGKDVGKSTFARFLVNKLLNSYDAVSFMDCDAGQTEFTPPAMLSLNKVTKPLLGPPFSHQAEPERSYFFGDLSPKNRPDYYIQCIQSLFIHYKEKFRKNSPLVINTQGWIKGMGAPLLLDIIRISNPSHIVQFNSSQPSKNLPKIDKQFVLSSPGWKFPASIDDDTKLISVLDNEKSVLQDTLTEHDEAVVTFQIQVEPYNTDVSKNGLCYRASDHRTLALLSYISGVQQEMHMSWLDSQTQVPPPDEVRKWCPAPLSHCVPYRVPWNSVALSVLHTEVPRSQILYSLNASIVGLAVMDMNEICCEDKEAQEVPQLLQNTAPLECVGLGIVRNIDPINKLFYILTPVPLDKLKRVNLLQKGSLEIPACLLIQHKRTNAPYVSSQFTFELRGAGARKVRYNLLRKKLETPRHVSS